MRDDAMMIRVSVKTARMYANGFNAPKGNGLNSGIWIFFYFDFWEFNFYLKISNIYFLWKKKKFQEIAKVLGKKCWVIVKKGWEEESCSGFL